MVIFFEIISGNTDLKQLVLSHTSFL